VGRQVAAHGLQAAERGPYVFRADEIERFEKQGKDVAQIRAEKADATGHYYRLMIGHVRHVLGDVDRVVPGHDAAAGYEIAGFVWFQAWNDMVDRGVYPTREKPGGYDAYSANLAHFIRDVRRDLDAPGMPFVIGVVGVGGPLEHYDNQNHKTVHGNFRAAMAAPASLPEFRGNVRAVPTAPYWDGPLAAIDAKRGQVNQMAHLLRSKNPNHANADGSMTPAEQKAFVEDYRSKVISAEERAMWERGASNAGYHYLGCAKTMALIGQAFAEAMLEMQSAGR
ncbi:MAG: sialate O-acetylesterase, partial [Planctomycetota bacterium]